MSAEKIPGKKSSSRARNTKAVVAPVIDSSSLVFRQVPAESSYLPRPLYPVPAAHVVRRDSLWWVRCASGEMIDVEVCHRAFLDCNALYRKDHPCWNCPLGKQYRDMQAEGKFPLTRLDTILQ